MPSATSAGCSTRHTWRAGDSYGWAVAHRHAAGSSPAAPPDRRGVRAARANRGARATPAPHTVSGTGLQPLACGSAAAMLISGRRTPQDAARTAPAVGASGRRDRRERPAPAGVAQRQSNRFVSGGAQVRVLLSAPTPFEATSQDQVQERRNRARGVRPERTRRREGARAAQSRERRAGWCYRLARAQSQKHEQAHRLGRRPRAV
jgi:hypothetical protein